MASSVAESKERVINTLESQGVKIIKINWNKSRSLEDITNVAKSVATTILNMEEKTFMDLHRRTM